MLDEGDEGEDVGESSETWSEEKDDTLAASLEKTWMGKKQKNKQRVLTKISTECSTILNHNVRAPVSQPKLELLGPKRSDVLKHRCKQFPNKHGLS